MYDVVVDVLFGYVDEYGEVVGVLVDFFECGLCVFDGCYVVVFVYEGYDGGFNFGGG